MKKLTLGLSVAALVIGGGAYAAQDTTRRGPDADGNGVITRAEAQSTAAAMFARMDANKDGKLDEADRAQHMQQMKTRMFDQLDTNKDGQISRAEFMAGKGPGDGHRMGGDRMGGPGRDRPDGAGMDDGDGMAMAEPGKGAGMDRRGHGRRHGGRGGADGMMGMAKMADANGDGAISQAEFTAAALKRFDTMDTNKDGQVTKEERQAGRSQMKARWQQDRAQKSQN